MDVRMLLFFLRARVAIASFAGYRQEWFSGKIAGDVQVVVARESETNSSL